MTRSETASLKECEAAILPARRNRSNEELVMRGLVVPELRKRWPSARIIHELPLRYSHRRIDLAAVTRDEIVSIEIKSSRDTTDRLESQLRNFIPVSTSIIVALAPKWGQELPYVERSVKGRIIFAEQLTPAQEIIRKIGDSSVRTWTVDAELGTVKPDGDWRRATLPWPARMLDMLHVVELTDIAERHRCLAATRRTTHDQLVSACNDLMTGRQILRAVCRALRARDAFARESDPPIVEQEDR